MPHCRFLQGMKCLDGEMNLQQDPRPSQAEKHVINDIQTCNGQSLADIAYTEDLGSGLLLGRRQMRSLSPVVAVLGGAGTAVQTLFDRSHEPSKVFVVS